MFVTDCETCGERILVCDNDVWLDWPARPFDAEHAAWTVDMHGEIALAVSAAVPGARRAPEAAGHSLHLHQPVAVASS